MLNIKALTKVAKEAALDAGKVILEIYNSTDFGVEMKGDNSLLTKADRAAHLKIVGHLEATGLPILSEEGEDIPYETRKSWEYFWMVDPLDGTKEFIKKNGEFTVNIALIKNGAPIMGVIYAPVLNWLYWADIEEGAWKQENDGTPIQLNKIPSDVKAIVASRSHLNKETDEFIGRYSGTEVISMGSSLKFMMKNKAQIYPRFAPTMEWGSAAAQAILEISGGNVLIYPEMEELKYNKEKLTNPYFIAK